MRVFVVLLVVAVATANANIFAKPGFPEGRIINGIEAGPQQAPYIVSLQSGSSHFCAGSLIGPSWIVTAAHCSSGNTINAVAGMHSQSDRRTVQNRQIPGSHQKIHESYAGGVGPYDLALMHVNPPFIMNGNVSFIKVCEDNINLNTKCQLFGWGRVNSGFMPDKLETLDMDCIDADLCKDALPPNAPIHKTNVCTFTPGESDGACSGDSGGPVIAINSDGEPCLMGCVSWGYVPCTSKMPSVHTCLPEHTPWINKTMENFAN